MSPHSRHPRTARRNLIRFVVIEVVLFLLAGVTAKNSNRPGLVSNVFWVAFLAGAALLILVVLIALVRKRVAAR
jgi:Na+/serine symporter